MQKQLSPLHEAMQIASEAIARGELDYYLVEVTPQNKFKILGAKDGGWLAHPLWEELA